MIENLTFGRFLSFLSDPDSDPDPAPDPHPDPDPDPDPDSDPNPDPGLDPDLIDIEDSMTGPGEHQILISLKKK